jgi:hypothetical protein
MIELKRKIDKLSAGLFECMEEARNSLILREMDKIQEELDKQIDSLAYDALNEACYLMQNKLGITDGGFASVFFSDDKVINIFKEYIDRELENIEWTT